MEKKGRSTSLRLSSKENKLIPRDLSESLGKLPPQDLKLEEEVLGAILLFSQAINRVKHFLRKEHFYAEAHAIIYEACLTIDIEGKVITSTSVVTQLRKQGQIDLIGGAYKIAELTAGVHSDLSIEQSARVIVEFSVKRSLIQVASQIYHDAYEDTTDAFELLQRSYETIKEVETSTVAETNEKKIKELWDTLIITKEPPKDPVLIFIQNTPVVIANNYITIMGKKKSRKTFLLVLLLADAFKNKTLSPDELIMFDTEQGKSDVWELREAIYRMTGHYVTILYLRGQTPVDRREIIKGTIQYWPKKIKLMILDGIRDTMSNINDPDETTEVIVWLEQLTAEYNLGIINILHMNKTDNNARGHLGTELLNKSWMTIELTLNEEHGCTEVKCESSRKKPFTDFAFTHGANDLPQLVGMPSRGNSVMPEDERRAALIRAFDDEPQLNYKQLTQAIQDQFKNPKGKNVGINAAQKMIVEFVNLGWVIKNGKHRDPNAVYKLMTSATSSPPPGFVPIAEAIERQNGQSALEFSTIPVEQPKPVDDGSDDLPF